MEEVGLGGWVYDLKVLEFEDWVERIILMVLMAPKTTSRGTKANIYFAISIIYYINIMLWQTIRKASFGSPELLLGSWMEVEAGRVVESALH